VQAIVDQLAATVREAAAQHVPLCIRGGGSKDFYGGPLRGETLSVAAYRGIIDYEPSELVITARAGTPLAEIETALRDKGQMLAFEPPHFGPQSTLGGCIAAGLSGPRRAYAGSVRDTVLGVRMVDGKGDDLMGLAENRMVGAPAVCGEIHTHVDVALSGEFHGVGEQVL